MTEEQAPLKILAKDPEDLSILSACLQDALVPVQGLNYDKKSKRFDVVAHRYRWELNHSSEPHPPSERINSGVAFENVEGVQFKGFHPTKDHSNSLNLLAVRHVNPYVHMLFSNKAQIRLKVPALKVKLRDGGSSWPAKKPLHSHSS